MSVHRWLPMLLACAGAASAQTPARIDLNSGAGPLVGSDPRELFRAPNGLVYFSACTPEHGCELWRSDGSASGTQLVVDLVPGSGSSEPRQMTAISNGAFTGVLFVSNLGSGSSIGVAHRSDGTAIGTVPLGVRKSSDPGTEMIVIGSAGAQIALMPATDQLDAIDRELWRSDTSLVGTMRVKDIASHQGSSLPSTPVIADKRAWFAAFTPANGFELYVSQGSAASTSLVADLRPGPTAVSRTLLPAPAAASSC